MKLGIVNTITRAANTVAFKVQKHSPELFLAAGIVGGVTAAVMACRATTKLNEVLEETKTQMDEIHEAAENPNLAEKYTEDDVKKDTAIIYTKTAVKIAKLYGPAIIIGAASITCVLASHNVMRQRNAALATAYAALDRSFKDYRGRVVERFGKEMDHELRYDIKAKEFVETKTDENGKETTEEKTVEVANKNVESEFTRYFARGNVNWENVPEYCEMFLHGQEKYANDKLVAKGHLTLNEVLRDLGFAESKMGMVIGWVYDPQNPIGDNYVDFGIRKVHVLNERGDGYEFAYALDFNVDGNIYNRL